VNADTTAMDASAIIEQWLGGTQPAVIFDFNGTLSDDEPILFDIFSELFATHLNWTLTDQEYRDLLLGHSDREIIEKAVARHGSGGDEQVEELLGIRREHYKLRVANHNPITDDAVALVEELAARHIPIGIVTGAQRADVTTVLGTSPVGKHIDVLVAEEDVRNGKPDPEGFLAGARRLRRRPSDILVFEDSVPGVRAALTARMQCIAISAEPSPELRAAAPVIINGLSADLISTVLTQRSQP
jgi:HAD superfamily hydrolase (TIGR01509 family)